MPLTNDQGLTGGSKMGRQRKLKKKNEIYEQKNEMCNLGAFKYFDSKFCEKFLQ